MLSSFGDNNSPRNHRNMDETTTKRRKIRCVRVKAKYRDDPEFREKKKKYAREYSRKHRDKINARRRSSPKEQANNHRYNTTPHRREYMKRVGLKKYNLTLEQFNAMWASQGGVCAICGQVDDHGNKWNSPIYTLRVDHDHATSQVRGLLCHHCNAGLGHFRDNPSLLKRAAEYLEKCQKHPLRHAA